MWILFSSNCQLSLRRKSAFRGLREDNIVNSEMGRMRAAPTSISYTAYVSLVLLAVLSMFPGAIGSQFTVGDSEGWTTDVNYTDWAAQYSFTAGDNIVFEYSKGSHDVLRVNQADYEKCVSSSPILSDASGETMFELVKEGSYYFICGFPGHCKRNQKVELHVQPSFDNPANSASAGGNFPFGIAEGPSASTLAEGPSSPTGQASQLYSFHSIFLGLVFGALTLAMPFLT